MDTHFELRGQLLAIVFITRNRHGSSFPLTFKTVTAKNLPYQLLRSPNCYARITIDQGPTFTTKPVKGRSAEWSECFDV
jgi:hypothetical protein